MDEYFEREALERSLNERLNRLFKLHGRHDHYVQGFDDCVGRVEEFPAADVAPVRHGRWDKDGCCTVCGEEAIYYWERSTHVYTDFCPNCGAKMDGGVDDG